MQVSMEQIADCKFSIRVEANTLEIMDKKAEVLQQFKSAPVPGNRPGHASQSAIKMYYKDQIEEATKRNLAESSYHEAIFQKELKPFGPPNFTSLFLDPGKFVCEFDITTKPAFDLPDWKSWELPKPHQEITAEVLSEQLLQELRIRQSEASPYQENDYVQQGDNVIIDYEATIDGKKIDSLCADGEMLTVGRNALVGFDTNLLGMKIGEIREFDFRAPSGGLPSLSDKNISFKVSLQMGSKITLCALDDELAKKMNLASLQELKQKVAEQAFMQVENANKSAIQNALGNKLVAETKINVPSFMSLSEAMFVCQQAQTDWETLPDQDKESMLSMASKNVALALILDKVREITPECQLSDEEVWNIIKQNISQTKVEGDINEIIQNMQKTGYLQVLMSRIKDEFAISNMLKQIKIVE